MNWKSLFTQTLSSKIRVSDRVKHRTTFRLGTVNQTAVVDGLPTISVYHDDGTTATLVPSEEYFKVSTQTLTWAGRGGARQQEA